MTIAAAQRKLKPWPPYQFGVFVFGDFANFHTNLTISGKAWHLPTSVKAASPRSKAGISACRIEQFTINLQRLPAHSFG